MAQDPDSHLSALYDFSTPALMRLLDSGLFNLMCRLTPVPGAGATFVGFTDAAVTRFKVVHEADGRPHGEVMQVKQLKLNLIGTGNSGLLAGGRQYVNTSNEQLVITDLNDLRHRVRSISVKAMTHSTWCRLPIQTRSSSPE